MSKPFCLACRGVGCSACQQTFLLGRITFSNEADWKASEPSLSHKVDSMGRCIDPVCMMDRKDRKSSLSESVAAVIDRTKAEPDRRSRECQ